jgi:predicted hydrolase (HD superfamily)
VFVIDSDTLIANALSLNDFDKQTEIEEIKGLYKLSAWHFAPGISYDFIRNRTYLTVSTSGLVNHFFGKRQENRRIGAIERKYKARDLADELKINNRVLAIRAELTDLQLAKKVVQIDIDIYKIQNEQYEKHEIDTEKFLNSKRNIINTIKNHNSNVTGLYKQILELSAICNSQIPADLSNLYFDLDFIGE